MLPERIVFSVIRTGLAALFFILSAGTVPSAADEPPETIPDDDERPHYEISKTQMPIKIEAVLDDEAWANAPKIDLPYEVMPGDSTPAPVQSDCMVIYDEQMFNREGDENFVCLFSRSGYIFKGGNQPENRSNSI